MSQNPGVGAGISSGTVVSTKTPLTPSAPTTATVGTSSSLVVSSNSSRTGLIIVNLSLNVVSLGFGSNSAVLDSGATLTTLGSVFQMSEYDYTIGAVNAIASATGSVISIQEYS